MPEFDIKQILTKAIADQKLIVTIPWLVQFLAMLDYITLRLNYFLDLLSMLYELYIMTIDCNGSQIQMRPTSSFIVRACLGWLFDQPNIPDEYYKYRQNRKPLQAISSEASTSTRHMKSVQLLVADDAAMFFAERQFVIAEIDQSTTVGTLKCVLKDASNSGVVEMATAMPTNAESILPTMDPMLEQILHTACPFLSDFRVSIMPAKHSKTVSRTGRFRHITTKLAELTPKKPNHESDNAGKLIEAFLHSQTLSVRRTVEFVIERTVSAVIKDFQMEVMLPTKRDSFDRLTNRIADATAIEVVRREMYECYGQARVTLIAKWDDLVPKNIWTRVKVSYCALAIDFMFENTFAMPSINPFRR